MDWKFHCIQHGKSKINSSMLPTPTTSTSLGTICSTTPLETSYIICFMLADMSIVQGGW